MSGYDNKAGGGERWRGRLSESSGESSSVYAFVRKPLREVIWESAFPPETPEYQSEKACH